MTTTLRGSGKIEVIISGARGGAGVQGNPGGSPAAVGLFSGLSGVSIPTGVDAIRTTGYSTVGIGAAHYAYDAAVDASYVAAHPRTSKLSSNGRGFRLNEPKVFDTMLGVQATASGNDSAALQAAIDHCQADGRRNLYLAPGIRNLGTQITLTGAGITMIGDEFSPMQNADTLPSVVLRWTGGASAMFVMSGSFWGFVGMAVENYGSATDFMQHDLSQWLTFSCMSYEKSTTATGFTRSIHFMNGNNGGYNTYDGDHVGIGAAPKFINIAGADSNGITPFALTGVARRGLCENTTLVYVENENLEGVLIESWTVNQQIGTGKLRLVDTGTNALDPAILSCVIRDLELDVVPASAAADDCYGLFKNVRQLSFEGACSYQAGPSATQPFQLVNSVLMKAEGNVQNAAGYLFHLDGTSRSWASPSDLYWDLARSRGLINHGAAQQIVPLTFGAVVNLQPELLPMAGGLMRLAVTSNADYQISYHDPANGFLVDGQTFGVMIENRSGGAIAAGTGVSTVKIAGGALPQPANGQVWTVWFTFNGTNVVETHRSLSAVAF